MTACFHLPSVVCENCAHLRSNSARPETRTFVTTDSTQPLPEYSGMALLAEKMMKERDEALAEVERLRAEAKRADDEATRLANSGLATTEQVIRALRAENERLRAALEKSMKINPHGSIENADARDTALRALGFDAVDPDTLGTLPRLRKEKP